MTLSRLTIEDHLWNWTRSVAAIDEASTAPVPFLLAVALRGAQGLLLFGDFRQLPPVGVSTAAVAEAWFGRDIYSVAGIVEHAEAGRDDPRLSMLTTQFRMAPEIADVISEFAYLGALRTDPNALARTRPLASLAPGSGYPLVIVDTGGAGTVCLQEAAAGSLSRLNPLSSLVATDIAYQLAHQAAAVGVITPYRAQARLLAASLRGVDGITTATVHRFQGSERDAIVLDVCDALFQKGPSKLTGSNRDSALRLLNTAASRARGKLVVVADLAFIDSHHPVDSQARRLIEIMSTVGVQVVSPEELWSAGRCPIAWHPTWADAESGLRTDLLLASTEIDISVPFDSDPPEWLAEALMQADGRGLKVTIRAPLGFATVFEDTNCDLRLKTLGAGPIAIVDNTIVWIGSYIANGPVGRIESAALTRALHATLGGGPDGLPHT